MERWKEIERKALSYIKNFYFDAELIGGSNSKLSDIYIPSLNFFIEVKDMRKGCRCGQFTEATVNGREYCKNIISGHYSSNDIKNFIIQHYQNKKVKYFLIYVNNSFIMKDFDSFLNDCSFYIQEYKKRSGTSKVPKKYRSLVLEYSTDFYLCDDIIKTDNSTLFQKYFNLNGISFYIGKTGEVRKRSQTNNLTWLINAKYDGVI